MSRTVACVLLTACWLSPLQAATTQRYGARSLIVQVPSHEPPAGQRALIIVLHGGMGNAARIVSGGSEDAMNMESVAERGGFVVAYLNGTPVTRRLGDQFLGWNAGGGCCGLAASNHIDDVAYIRGAVDMLTAEYGIDRHRIYAIGHSNGAMMVQRLMCETDLLAAAVAISGPLNLETTGCPAAHGKRILAIHGADDRNVPIDGGQGTVGISSATYASEARSRQVFTDSGADYQLDVVRGADHKLDDIDAVVRRTEAHGVAGKAARFFGLSPPG